MHNDSNKILLIQAAGVFLTSLPAETELVSGLGARHAAAAAVTMRTTATAIVVSATDGNVRAFSGDKMVLQIDPDVAHGHIGMNRNVLSNYMPPSFGRTAAAKLKTKKKPHMSVTVVSSGLETRAGSSFNRLSTRGNIPPRMTETSVLAAKAPPTTSAEPRISLPEKGDPAQQQAKHQTVDDADPGLLCQHPEQFARPDQAKGEFTHGNRHGLVAGTAAHVADHGQKNRQGNDCGKGILIQGNDTCGDDIEDNIHAQPGQTAAGTGEQRHGPELLTADDTAQPQKCFCLPLIDRFLNGIRQHHADQPPPIVHNRHAEKMMFLEKLLEAL